MVATKMNDHAPTDYDEEIVVLREAEEATGRPRLDPLDAGTIRIAGGDGDVDPGQKYGYSAIVGREIAATRKVYGWIRNVHLSPEQVVVAEGLMELFRMEWMAPCANRDGRFAKEEAKAQGWIKMLGGQKRAAAREAIDEADGLLKTWNTQAAFKLQVEIQRLRLGLDAVEEYRGAYQRASSRPSSRRDSWTPTPTVISSVGCASSASSARVPWMTPGASWCVITPTSSGRSPRASSRSRTSSTRCPGPTRSSTGWVRCRWPAATSIAS